MVKEYKSWGKMLYNIGAAKEKAYLLGPKRWHCFTEHINISRFYVTAETTKDKGISWSFA